MYCNFRIHIIILKNVLIAKVIILSLNKAGLDLFIGGLISSFLGVAYLDDGTMIVVDNARRCIGRNVDVTVTSVLQTTAGRMIFTRLKEESEREEYQVARG